MEENVPAVSSAIGKQAETLETNSAIERGSSPITSEGAISERIYILTYSVIRHEAQLLRKYHNFDRSVFVQKIWESKTG